MSDTANAVTETGPRPITRPKTGESLTGRVWDIADEISRQHGRPALRKEVIDRYLSEVEGGSKATVNTQYARWLSFNDASSVVKQARADKVANELAAKEAEKASAKEAKVAEREAKVAERNAAKEAKAAEQAAAKEAKAAERQAAKEAKAAAKAESDAAAKAAAE